MAVNFSGLTVLIVEDSGLMRDILRSMLQALGVEQIFESADGKAGLTAMRRVEPDIVLLDWAMPVMDGIELLRAIRQKNERLADSAVIMVASFADESKFDQAYAAGADELVPKPFSALELHAAIERALLERRPMVTRGDYHGPAMPEWLDQERVEPSR